MSLVGAMKTAVASAWADAELVVELARTVGRNEWRVRRRLAQHGMQAFTMDVLGDAFGRALTLNPPSDKARALPAWIREVVTNVMLERIRAEYQARPGDLVDVQDVDGDAPVFVFDWELAAVWDLRVRAAVEDATWIRFVREAERGRYAQEIRGAVKKYIDQWSPGSQPAIPETVRKHLVSR